MLTQELRADIDKIWNTFWTGGISNPLSVIEQITYLLFIKRLDELQQLKENKASLLGKPIEKPIYQPSEKELRWSSFKDLEPEQMHKLFTKENGVFDFMKNYGAKDSAFGRFMKGAVFMIPTPRLLANVVDMLSGIDMKDRDTKGDVYEYLLSKIASAGTNGQFRTPRHIIKMMVDLMQPGPEDVICDPSAGSCGFLVGCAEYIRAHHHKEFFKPGFEQYFSNDMFMGMEFDPTMIRIGAMNMILHGIEEPVLKDVDALSDANSSFTEQATLIMANPPFTGSLDKDAVDKEILRVVDSKKTELLFLALILKGLKKGGRAAVIIPDGVLFGSSKAHKQIRQELVDKHRLQAVISMPGGVFKPYAGVSTGVLIFTKTGNGGTDNVWFYDMKGDGYTLDDKRQPDEKNNDIPDIVNRWYHLEQEATNTRTDKSFFVPVAEIRNNGYDLSINRYKETVYEEKQYAAPAEIIAEIKQMDKERADALKTLEKLLQGKEVATV
ncbi:MAG: SAM-dependent DNA methyltransferase [Taibaiella sp.]|nr:SAM-dependent DNA methyltransferase [Taibaiella sp.]